MKDNVTFFYEAKQKLMLNQSLTRALAELRSVVRLLDEADYPATTVDQALQTVDEIKMQLLQLQKHKIAL